MLISMNYVMEILSYIFKVITVTADIVTISIFYMIWTIYEIKYHRKISDKLKISVLSMFLAMLLTLILKAYFQTSRPCCSYNNLPFSKALLVANQYGFPSGHTGRATIIALTFLDRSHLIRSILLILWMLLIAYSRVYLEKHTILDVVGGFFVGLVSYLAIYFIFKTRKKQT